MTRTWFSSDLETVATFWRLLRRDGVTLGFTAHDADLWFDGVLHLASPGMVPSSIRKSAGFEADSAEVQGALTHEAISAADLTAGRFDGATVRIGLIDWETGESLLLYAGTLGSISTEDGQFSAELVSRKAELQRDPVPRTSPACRAAFCGPGCNLGAAGFTDEMRVASLDIAVNAVRVDAATSPARHSGGTLRWLDGPMAGEAMGIMAVEGDGALVLDTPLDSGIPVGARALVREGCDHTLDTCAARFGNAANFRGEPYLPGNDLLTSYPTPAS
ncbi:putative phage protein (TIGR02218 family) [Novosphingobium sp. PhB165]|uniref:DUF2163 domain-containing protein n=1 Tax=Novosphingobium sp. PhB165 TaxID=2485105 RepID=UPI001052648F|nr:DUF2163 domain-containing protein [Novosphingobium sp. PhB165]TCM16954.1 putative phage protein (TIGR02218 family) [Novosphingobium sp. PhB165]